MAEVSVLDFSAGLATMLIIETNARPIVGERLALHRATKAAFDRANRFFVAQGHDVWFRVYLHRIHGDSQDAEQILDYWLHGGFYTRDYPIVGPRIYRPRFNLGGARTMLDTSSLPGTRDTYKKAALAFLSSLADDHP